MGPMTLLRGFGEDMDARRDRLTDAMMHILERMTSTRDWFAALPQAARPALDAMLAAPRRLWVSERATTICVIGGILSAPLLTVLACIGLLTPMNAPLHQGAQPLMVVAVVLLLLSLMSAQAHTQRTSASDEE